MELNVRPGRLSLLGTKKNAKTDQTIKFNKKSPHSFDTYNGTTFEKAGK